MNSTVVVIGTGNIGTRHLQAILKCEEPCDIYAVETSLAAQNKARETLGTLCQRVFFCDSISKLPEMLDVVVVAVSSKARRQVTEELLEHRTVRYLILEKVLFPQVEDYIAVQHLLKQTGTKAWVNCVRRSWPYTRRLQDLFSQSKQVSMKVNGNMWGLACNTIHFVDWLSAIMRVNEKPTFDISQLDDEILESKRCGYVEFSGTLLATLGANTLQLISREGIRGGLSTTLESECVTCHIEEMGDRGENSIYNRITGEIITENFECPYQSNLTNRIVSELLTKGTCALVEYDQSMEQHIPMIQAFLKKMGATDGYCNIT